MVYSEWSGTSLDPTDASVNGLKLQRLRESVDGVVSQPLEPAEPDSQELVVLAPPLDTEQFLESRPVDNAQVADRSRLRVDLLPCWRVCHLCWKCQGDLVSDHE